MTDREKDLMERYIYEVTRRVKKEQREDIAMELRELITDMYEQKNEESGEDADTMICVLKELGDPAEFAKKYRDEKSVLIGPEYYDNYIWVLKLVMTITVIVTIIATVFEGIIDNSTGAISGTVSGAVSWAVLMGEAIGEGIASLISSFGAVTLIFAIMERRKVKVDLSNARKEWNIDDLEAERKVWTPLQLPPMPDKRGIISRSDCVVSIVFILLFGGFLIMMPGLFGVLNFEDGKLVSAISFLNLEKWNTIIPILACSLLLGLIQEIVNLVYGYYCKTVMFLGIAINVVQMVLSAIMLKVFPFWNPNFENEIRSVMGNIEVGSADLMFAGPNIASNAILAIILVITLIEIGVTIYKTIRYGVDVK